MIKGLRVFFIMIKMNCKSYFKYMGWSALASYLSHITGYLTKFMVLYVTVRLFNNLGGFNMWQIFILYSIDLLAYALANMFLQPFWSTYGLIARGELDEYLTKPVYVLPFIMAKGFQLGYIAHISLSVAVLVVSFTMLKMVVTPALLLILIFSILCGVCIYMVFGSIPGFLAFWLGNTDNLRNLIGFTIRNVTTYPLSIYPTFIRLLFTVCIPYAFINYYPTLTILDMISDTKKLLYLSLAGIIALLCIVLMVLVFHKGLKRYESAGG